MTKICFVNSCKAWGGGEKWHFETALEMAMQPADVFVFANKNGDLYQRLKPLHQIKLYSLDVSNLSFLNIFKLLYLAIVLKKNNIEVVVLGLSSDVKLAGIAAKLAGIKKIIYRRGLPLPVKNTLINQFIFSKILTDVIVNSHDVKHKLLFCNDQLIPDSKIHLVYNGVKLNEINKNEKHYSDANKVILGNAGRFSREKGQFYLLELAEKLKSKNINFKLLIAGKGEQKEILEKKVREKNLSDNIEFTDFIYDISIFFNKIDIYVHPSLHEGTSNVLLEAMAYSKPIVAFNVSSMPEIIHNEKSGYLAEFGDINDMCNKTELLIQDKELRIEMGLNARAIVEKRFDYQKNIQQFYSILKNNPV